MVICLPRKKSATASWALARPCGKSASASTVTPVSSRIARSDVMRNFLAAQSIRRLLDQRLLGASGDRRRQRIELCHQRLQVAARKRIDVELHAGGLGQQLLF